MDEENISQQKPVPVSGEKDSAAEPTRQKDGKRVKQLQAAINKALEKTLRSCTYEYKSLYRKSWAHICSNYSAQSYCNGSGT